MIIVTLALVLKHHTGQRKFIIWSESMTGKKESDWRQKQPKLGEKVELIFRRQGCQRDFVKT